jgi:HPt (histidine-containing phosphotransfer) domain-containing protein
MLHLDLTYIKENVSDDPAFIRELLDVFLTSLEIDIPALEESIEKADYEYIRRNAHKIKSGFRSLGMKDMTDYLQSLEDMGKHKEEMSGIREQFAGFISALPEIKKEIINYRD